MELNYDELVHGYNEGLHNTLRKFKPGPDFLDTWVPDEDHTKSIFGIFEAAKESNEESLTVILSDLVSGQIDRQWIKSMSQSMGNLSFSKGADGEVLSMKYFKGEALKISPVYQKALEQYSKRVCHEGVLTDPAAHQVLISVKAESVTFTCFVNEKNVIVAAKHLGAAGTVRVLLDQLCAEIQGRPFQEASEHGVIKLEFKLRDKSVPRHKQGIILPHNADPAFRLPEVLIRRAFADYQNKTQYAYARNFFLEALSPTFAALSTEKKIQAIQDALIECCSLLGLQTKDIEVVGLKPEARAVIHFRQDSYKPQFGKAMIRLEQMLHDRIDPSIELVLESLEDRNKRKERRGESSVMDNIRKAATSNNELKGEL